jgi:aromatic aminotransferase
MQPSARVRATDSPVIGKMLSLAKNAKPGLVSLAQGVVFWDPPSSAIEHAKDAMSDQNTHMYCPTSGLPELIEGLKEKLARENALKNVEVIVTSGANQAFTNVVLSLCDSTDGVVLFPPYYFNHIMAFQMTGVSNIVLGEREAETYAPDVGWIDKALSSQSIKMVVITNPCNPTGTVLSRERLEAISAICKKHGCWLVCDNTYEYFIYDNDEVAHSCIEAPHVVNIYSFSKGKLQNPSFFHLLVSFTNRT